MKKYSETDTYKERIYPAVKKVLLICEQCKIPVFMSFATENGSEGTHYENEMLSAEAVGRQLKDDQLVKHVLIMNGFEAVPSIGEPTIEEVGTLTLEDDEDPPIEEMGVLTLEDD